MCHQNISAKKQKGNRESMFGGMGLDARMDPDDFGCAKPAKLIHRPLDHASTCSSWRSLGDDSTDVPSPNDSTDLASCPPSPRSIASRSHLDMWMDPKETLIIVDWDDTLCPTSHYEMFPECTSDESAALLEHAKAVERFVRVASALGRVCVVSMAGRGWIDKSIEMLMPSLKETFRELNIDVKYSTADVPASVLHEASIDDRSPGHYLKRRAMGKVVRDFYSGPRAEGLNEGRATKARSWKNVVSIGDSEDERLAIQDLIMGHTQRDRKGVGKDCRCKTLKLKEEPSLVDLSVELESLTKFLPAIVYHDGDLDLDCASEAPSVF